MSTAAGPGLPAYDVVVIGGSLSGASTATLLLRENPGQHPVAREMIADAGWIEGDVSQPFKKGIKGLLEPPFSEPLSRPDLPNYACLQPSFRPNRRPPPRLRSAGTNES